MSDEQKTQEQQAPLPEDDLGPNAQAQSENIGKAKVQAEKIVKQRVKSHGRISKRLEGMKCWPEVLALLENGERVVEIARFIQEDRREALEVKRQSLVGTIYYWINKNQDRRSNMSRAPTKHVLIMQSMSENVDSLDAINMLFAIQVDRITEHYAAEKEHKNYTNFNNNAIRIAKEIVQTMSDIEQKRRPMPSAANSDSGIGGGKSASDTYSALQRMAQSYADRFGINAAKVVLNDESRRRVMSALDKVRMGESKDIVNILNKNGVQADKLRQEEEERVREETASINMDAPNLS